jgi:hypothetical protein
MTNRPVLLHVTQIVRPIASSAAPMAAMILSIVVSPEPDGYVARLDLALARKKAVANMNNDSSHLRYGNVDRR